MIQDFWRWVIPLKTKASSLLKKGAVKHIVFSRGTYQVEVFDESLGESVWPFFQFDDQENLKDSFCSCSEENHCIHQAISLLKIFNETTKPLHVRFEASFWHAFTWLAGEHFGFEQAQFEKREGRYFFSNGMELSIEAKTPATLKWLQSIIESRIRENPENSLKFSGLSSQEISRWKEGRPSETLRYELSFWGDFAKEMMLRAEEGIHPKFKVKEDKGLPLYMEIHFRDLEISIAYTSSDLTRLIPTFATIDAPLKIISPLERKVEAVSYDPVKKTIFIRHAAEQELTTEEIEKGTRLGDWIYFRQKGFYLVGEKLLDKEEIRGEEIDDFLDENYEKMNTIVKKPLVNGTRHSLSYDLFFDENWNLHFIAYLFKKGDLLHPLSSLFRRWAYIEHLGFFRVDQVLFKEVHAIVPPHQIPLFINQHRVWLQQQDGFSIHVAGIETQMTYMVSAKNELKFYGKVQSQQEEGRAKEFGDLIYFEKIGFFTKRWNRSGIGVRPGLEIPSHAISTFIHSYRDELELIAIFSFLFSP